MWYMPTYILLVCASLGHVNAGGEVNIDQVGTGDEVNTYLSDTGDEVGMGFAGIGDEVNVGRVHQSSNSEGV
jgi:hypothetical protein